MKIVKVKVKKQKVYICGQMSNLVPDDAAKNREEYMERFHKTECLVSNNGYWAVSPIRFWVCRWPWLYRLLEKIAGRELAYQLVLLYDLLQLSRCDLIYKIPGWRESRGACIESTWSYHMKIWTLPVKKRDAIDKKMVKFIDKRLVDRVLKTTELNIKKL